VDRLSYVITPRFSPTSTPEQLEAMGALWAAHPDCLMQTHLSEQVDEIAWVKSLFPSARDYLDTYEAFGLLAPTGFTATRSIWSRASGSAGRGGRRAGALPDLEHLHRVRPV
jgi:cytosine/adenosine deaminase-related metal-dependent hydrolase